MSDLTDSEVTYLSAWAREERVQDCWSQPAHRLQAVHKVPSINFIRLIKAWATATGKRDLEIYEASIEPSPPWPWSTSQELATRLQELTSSVRTPNGSIHPHSAPSHIGR